jgi:hypothetical protein
MTNNAKHEVYELNITPFPIISHNFYHPIKINFIINKIKYEILGVNIIEDDGKKTRMKIILDGKKYSPGSNSNIRQYFYTASGNCPSENVKSFSPKLIGIIKNLTHASNSNSETFIESTGDGIGELSVRPYPSDNNNKYVNYISYPCKLEFKKLQIV